MEFVREILKAAFINIFDWLMINTSFLDVIESDDIRQFDIVGLFT